MTRRELATVAVLGAFTFASAVATVRTKHENRNLVYEIDQLRAEVVRLETEWSQLQLEEATLAHHGRVEQIARERIGMDEPDAVVPVSTEGRP